MSMILRRTALGLVSLAAIVAVAMYSQQAETPTYTFRITLGLKDKEPADWSGKVAVADGEVVELTGWRFEEKDAVEGTTQLEVPDPRLHRARRALPARPRLRQGRRRRRNSPGPTASPSPCAAPRRP